MWQAKRFIFKNSLKTSLDSPSKFSMMSTYISEVPFCKFNSIISTYSSKLVSLKVFLPYYLIFQNNDFFTISKKRQTTHFFPSYGVVFLNVSSHQGETIPFCNWLIIMRFWFLNIKYHVYSEFESYSRKFLICSKLHPAMIAWKQICG